MTLPVEINPHLLGGAAAGGYQIERSLRFNSADTAYLSKTFSTTPINRAKKTVSFWCKRSTLSSTQHLVGSYNGGGQDGLFFNSSNSLQIYAMGGGAGGTVNGVLRDVSAWYHIFYVIDTTQATAGDRLKIWINGVNFPSASWTAYSTPSLNSTADILFFQSTEIGRDDYTSSSYFNGYLTEFYYIDGQALDETDFGEFNATTGVWQPIEYTGTFGTNGFYLNFSDNSDVTAATLGADSSGNGNNWTPNGFVVSPVTSADNDSLVDTPTNYGTDTGVGGEVRGNYCTWNPLQNAGALSISNGNLDIPSTSYWANAIGTLGATSGKWYYEAILGNRYGSYQIIGVVTSDIAQAATNSSPYNRANSIVWLQMENVYVETTSYATTSYYDATVRTVSVAFDLDNWKFHVRMDGGAWQNSGDPAAGTGGYDIPVGMRGKLFLPIAGPNNVGADPYIYANFGQRPFAYTAPSGFKALCTQNLPAGTVTTSGSFTGNLATDGPFVYLNGVPTAMTINGNAVTFGTHADKLANGFKVRSSSSSYNASGTNTYSVSTTGEVFKNEVAQSNP